MCVKIVAQICKYLSNMPNLTTNFAKPKQAQQKQYGLYVLQQVNHGWMFQFLTYFGMYFMRQHEVRL